jgi:hypothetical protein
MPDWKDFLPELVCLGLDGIICGALYVGYARAACYAKELTNAQEIPISSNLKKQIECHPLAKKIGDTIVIPYVTVRGSVTPMGRTVASGYVPEIQNGVIQKVVFTEHKRNLSRTGFWIDSERVNYLSRTGFWIDSERVMHQYVNETPFFLTNPQWSSMSLSRPKIEVCDWADATKIELDTIFDKFDAGANTLGSHILGWVQGDLHKGTQITESMLLKDTPLTAVGQLVSSPAGVQIKPPSDGKPFFLVRSSISSLIKEYESEKEAFKIVLRVFTGIGVIVSAIGIYRYWRQRKQELVASANQNTINSIIADRETREARSDVPEHLQCLVCRVAEREVIILPCGHVCVCASCGRELINLQQGCPVCRANIDAVHQAFVS